jgi:2-C-methyl-D-erythritol 2,4-cyclodiphosphate synthase
MVLSGIGYDVHALAEGRPLILGGVEIAHPRGLLGHSDADVLAHAIADALLGAVGAGDIGHHFPNTDESIRGLRSTRILAEVAAILAGRSARIINIDATVIAEAPKLAPHLGAMRAALAEALQMPAARISIKATTNEGLGFLGRSEGIAAMAVASVEQAEADEATAPPLPAVGL